MSIATTSTPLVAMARSIGSSALRSLRCQAPPCRSRSVGNGPAPCGWWMRAISWRPALFLRNGTSLTLRSYFAAGSYLPAARAPSGSPAAAPRALIVCRKLRRCIGILLRESLQHDLLAVVAAMVLLAAGGEDDLVAAHLAFDRHGAFAIRERAREHLEGLLQGELALRQLVLAGDARRHDPEERRAPRAVARLDIGFHVGLPVAHREGIGRDARSGFQPEKLGPELQIDVRQEEHGDDGGFGEIGLEEIGLHELRAIGDARGFGVSLGERH